MVDSRIQLFAFFRKNPDRAFIESEQLAFLDDESRSTFRQLCAQIEESDDALSDLALSEMANVEELRTRYGVIDPEQ